MKYSAYIGRVGALAVALGIGAAVANGPAIAFAEANESGQTDTKTEASQNAPADETPGDEGQQTGDQGGDGAALTEPADAVDDLEADTELEENLEIDDALDAGEEEQQGGDVIDPSGDGDAPPTGGGDGPPANLPAESQGAQQQGQQTVQQLGSNTDVNVDLTETPQAPEGDDISVESFTTAAVDESPSHTETLRTLALDEPAPAAQDPITALFTLPLRIVDSVLSGILGGPSTPSGENPLFLGLLAFVRRQFSPFTRTFSNQAPVITGAQVDENEDGTFTITVDTEAPDVDAFDPDGDPLTFTAANGEDGTVVKTGPNTFTYTPPETGWDGEDTITITAGDPGGLFGFNRKSASVTVSIVAAGEDDPTQPDVTQPPTPQEDGTVEAELKFDPTKVVNVTVAEGFAPKYWTFTEVYNAETGEYEISLTPTQAAQLRAALGLDTDDFVGLQVTTADQQMQTFSLRTVSFAALAEGPDYTMTLPDPPAGDFVVSEQAIPVGSEPAGVVVTDRYAYVMNTELSAGSGVGNGSITVIGADPEEADYNQVVTTIEGGPNAAFGALAGDRLYVVSPDYYGGQPRVTVIDTTTNTVVGDPIDLPGGLYPITSPDGKRIYVVDQQNGDLHVIDADPTSPTYNTIIDDVDVSPGLSAPVQDPDTGATTVKFLLGGAFNADGSRLYVIQAVQTITPGEEGPEVTYDSEAFTVDTVTNEVVGDPVTLGRYAGYAWSDGSFLYVPTFDMSSYDPTDPDLSDVDGVLTIVDIQSGDPVLVDLDPGTPEVDGVAVGPLPTYVALSPDKSLIYVVNAQAGTVTVVDTVNREVLDVIVFDDSPTGGLTSTNAIGISPDGQHIYITNFGDGTVTALEFVTA
ncbi:Ig-like domain-containing protein [Mycolicibacterium sp. XJ1819]